MATSSALANRQKPEVLGTALLSIQVCVPADWSDAQVITFAESQNPSGVSTGWQVRKTGEALLRGDPERNPCSERSGCVHITLDC
ncbi:MAG: hypothetical protein AMXMBFR56_68540 [Polyangiaceae bacterium]